MGSGRFQVTRDFGYNRIAAVSDNSSESYHYEKIAKNDDGYLRAERTDFYRALYWKLVSLASIQYNGYSAKSLLQ